MRTTARSRSAQVPALGKASRFDLAIAAHFGNPLCRCSQICFERESRGRRTNVAYVQRIKGKNLHICGVVFHVPKASRCWSNARHTNGVIRKMHGKRASANARFASMS